MKFVHTFWSAPLIHSDKYMPHFDFQSWKLLRLTEYALSVECVHSNGYKIILITDEYGYDLFKDIQYDEVLVIRGYDNNNVTFAAQFKFLAMSHIDLGDVLIDGDLFLQNPILYDKLLKTQKEYDIVYAHNETQNRINEWHEDYHKVVKPLFEHFNLCNETDTYHFPTTVKDMYWPNTCLIQINNEQLRYEYIQQYMYHMNILSQAEAIPEYWLDIIVEQYFLGCLLKNSDYKSYAVMCDDYDSLNNKGDESLGFLHIQSYKHIFHETIINTLAKYNPVLFNTIIDKCKNEVPN